MWIILFNKCSNSELENWLFKKYDKSLEREMLNKYLRSWKDFRITSCYKGLCMAPRTIVCQHSSVRNLDSWPLITEAAKEGRELYGHRYRRPVLVSSRVSPVEKKYNLKVRSRVMNQSFCKRFFEYSCSKGTRGANGSTEIMISIDQTLVVRSRTLWTA